MACPTCRKTCCRCCGAGWTVNVYVDNVLRSTQSGSKCCTSITGCVCTNIPLTLNITLSGTCFSSTSYTLVWHSELNAWFYTGSVPFGTIGAYAIYLYPNCEIHINGFCTDGVNLWAINGTISHSSCVPFLASGSAIGTGACCDGQTILISISG